MLRLRRSVAFALAAAALSSHAQDAGVPSPEAGDSWTYRQDVETEGHRSEHHRMELAVVGPNRDSDWILSVRDADAPRPASAVPGIARIFGVVSGHGCLADIFGPVALQRAPCATPRVGDRWTIDRPGAKVHSEVEVAGRSHVEVPAGAFDAIELVVADTSNPTSAAAASSALGARHRLWYAPEVRAIVRAQREFPRADGTIETRQVEVLESFIHHGVRTPAEEKLQMAPAPTLVRRAAFFPSPGCKPKYPDAAIRAQVMGVTRLRYTVAADGRVTGSEIIQSSGPTREHRLLDQAARSVLATCYFAPAVDVNGTPLGDTVNVAYSWKLD